MPDDPPRPVEIGEDTLLGGAVRLRQPRRGHRAGTDAVLLANLATIAGRDLVVDLGAASGAVGLIAAIRRPDARVVFVERDPTLLALCRDNIALNGLGDRAEAVEADIFAPMSGLPGLGRADLVLTNPPFFQSGEKPSPEAGRRTAHRMEGGDLTGWLRAAADWLKHRGRLTLIHRADHLDVCLAALSPRFGSIAVRPIHPRADAEATRILVTASKDGRAPLRVIAPMILHGVGQEFAAEAALLHRQPAD